MALLQLKHQPRQRAVLPVERELAQDRLALRLERALEGLGERAEEPLRLLGVEQPDDRARLSEVGRERLRELRVVAPDLAPQELLELAVLLDQPLDALAEAPALGMEVVLERTRELHGHGALVVGELALELAQHALALLADRVGVDASLGLLQGQHPDAQRARGELAPCAPLRVRLELGDHLRVADLELQLDGIGSVLAHRCSPRARSIVTQTPPISMPRRRQGQTEPQLSLP